MRFQLEESNVRDLLMGETLYGDSSLAIRELYQNAVDACRHLDARRRYLGLDPFSADEVRVRFTEGVDDAGRRYIECADTGVGLGLVELEQAFSRAGVRATDRTEYRAELADYERAEPPVALWTNSQFGIGVLSYFMLASEVQLTSTVFHRDGTLGRRLQVSIAGPDAEFIVEDHGPGTEAGTALRLILNPTVSISAVSTLRDWVIICPYAMIAADLSGLHHEWSPRALNLSSSKAIFDPELSPVEDSETGVWWVDRAGPVLADGLWAESCLFGTVINLTGDLMPRLTIDRRRILEFDEAAVDAMTISAIPTAVSTAWNFVGTAHWLDTTFPFNPALVDAIAEAAAALGLTIVTGTVSMGASTGGYVVGESELSPGSRLEDLPAWWATRAVLSGGFPELAVDTSAWSLPVGGRPSDAVFLGTVRSTVVGLTWQYTSRWAGDEIAVYDTERHLRRPISAIVARAHELGLPVPGDADSLPETTEFIRRLLERNDHWRYGQDRRFMAFCIVVVATECGLSLREAAAQLMARRLTCDERWPGLVDQPPTPQELLAASRRLDGAEPWCPMFSTIDRAHVLEASKVTGRTPKDVGKGLQRLGFDVQLESDVDVVFKRSAESPANRMRGALTALALHLGVSEEDHGRVDHWPLTEDDVWAASTGLRLTDFWPQGEPLGPLDVRDRAGDLSCSTKEFRARLRGLGYTVEKAGYTVKELTEADRVLLSREGNGRAPWRRPGETVGLVDLMVLSAHVGATADAVAADLRRLGFGVAESDPLLPTLRPGAGEPLGSVEALHTSLFLVQTPGRAPFIDRN